MRQITRLIGGAALLALAPAALASAQTTPQSAHGAQSANLPTPTLHAPAAPAPAAVRVGTAPGAANPTGAPVVGSGGGPLKAGGSVEVFAVLGVGGGAAGGFAKLDATTFAGTQLSDVVTPGGLTGVTSTPDGRVWAVSSPGFSSGNTLHELNPATGAVISSVGITGGGGRISDLATQPGTGTVYATGSGTFGDIYTLNTTTGVLTFLGNCGVVTGGIAFAPDGTFYAISVQVGNDFLAVVNPATGTAISTIAYGPHNGLDGLAVRPSDSALIATRGAFAGGDQIIQVDPVTGNTTFLGNTGLSKPSSICYRTTPGGSALYAGVSNGSASGTPGSFGTLNTSFSGTVISDPVTPGGFTGLTSTLDGRLWGVTTTGFGTGNTLIELDPSTGSVVSSKAITGGGNRISDLATQPSTGTVYATGSGTFGDIYKLDVNTGALSFVGNCGIVTGGIAFAADGTFYAISVQVGNDFLAVVDPNTGGALSTIGYGPNVGIHALTIRPSDGALIGATGQFNGADIVQIDPVTGATTNLGPTGIGAVALAYVGKGCPPLAAVPGVLRFAVPPNPGGLTPFSQPKVIVGAAPFGTPAPDVLFTVPNPGTTALIVWSISLAPASIALPPLGTILISISPPNPVVSINQVFAISAVISAGAVPNSCALVGLPIFTQGAYVETNGAIGFTNAIDYVIGTF